MNFKNYYVIKNMSWIAGLYRNFIYDRKVKSIIKKQRKLIAEVADDNKTVEYEGCV